MKLRVKSPAKPRAELHTKPLAKPRAELHTKPLAKPLTVRLTKPLVKLLLAHRKAALLSAPCKKKCGGCQLLQIPYEKQLEQKQEEMFRLFKPFSNPHTIFSPIFGMDEPFYYRNKVTSPYVPGKKLSSHSRKDKRADAQQANKRSSLRKNLQSSTR